MLREFAGIVTDELELRLASGRAIRNSAPLAKTDDELAATRQQLRNVIMNAPGPRALLDRDYRYVTASKLWCRLFHLDGTPYMGRYFGDLTPEMRGELKELRSKALTGASAESGDVPIEIDGEEKWLRLILNPWRDENGDVVEFAAIIEDVTERKLAEFGLERSRAFLEAVLDNVEDGIVACDASGEFSLFNKACRRLQVIDPRQQAADSWVDHYDPDDESKPLSRQELPLFRAFAGEYIDNERMVIAPPGQPRKTLIASGCPIFSANGSKLGAVVSMNDVTEREAAEAAIMQRKAELRLILDNVPVRVWLKDDRNRIVRLNEAAARSMGMNLEEATGINLSDLDEGPAGHSYEADLVVLKSGQPKLGVVEETFEEDGTSSWIRVDKVPYTDPETGSRFILVTAIDITAERDAAETLRENEARFRFLYNNTPALLHTVDLTGRITSVSDFWLETLGYTRKEVLGKASTDFQTAESAAEAVKSELPALLENGASQNNSYRFVKKSGEIVDVLMSSVAERDEDGNVVSGISVLTDVTQMKALEIQLMQSQKMEAVGQLTGGLAHDFNNLLAVIIGNLQLLERALGDDARARKKASSALKAAERGADLTQRLLAFSRRQTLDTEVIDVNDLVHGMQDMLTRTLGSSIKLNVHLADNIWPTDSDIGQLESAILNLAVNARDAMDNGGTLTIETARKTLAESYAATHSEVSPGDYVVISVSDTGCGIPAEYLEKVFQPFFSTKEVGRGTGLGLSMVYGFAKQTGGHVGVYSEPGYGSTFRLYLPRSGSEVDTAGGSAEADRKVIGGAETILVVEDNDDVREITITLLEDLGYSVLVANNGQRALKILQECDDIDLLFTDIVMPGGLDGAELALQAVKLRPAIKVVYASGFADAVAFDRSRITTGGTLISKPFQRDELALMVREALDGPPPEVEISTAALAAS